MNAKLKIMCCCFMLMLAGIAAHGQDSTRDFDYVNFTGGYHLGHTQQLDAGLSLSYNMTESIFEEFVYHGPYLKCGYNWGHGNLLHVNAGYEFVGYFMIFLGRINLNGYSDFSRNQYTLLPEIGLTLLVFLNLTYGYNFNLSQEDFYQISGHYVGIDIHWALIDLKYPKSRKNN